MKSIISLLLLLSISVSAEHRLDSYFDNIRARDCGEHIEFKNDYLFSISNIKKNNKWVGVATLFHPQYQMQVLGILTERGGRIQDLEVYGDSIYLLTDYGLEERSLHTMQYRAFHPTYHLSGMRAFKKKENPTRMELSGDKLVISHGILGVSVFDLKQKKLAYQTDILKDQRPDISMAQDVKVKDGRAYIVFDNYTLKNPRRVPAFRGVVVMDIETGKEINRARMYDAGSTGINIDNGVLWVNFNGFNILAGYDLKEVETKKKVSSIYREFKNLPIYDYYKGGVSIVDRMVYSCVKRQGELASPERVKL